MPRPPSAEARHPHAQAAPTVYLAGPDVFEREPLAVGLRLKEVCRRHGLRGVFPMDAQLRLDGLDPPGRGHAISAANEAAIRGCAGVLANLTPFRGPSADVGTAFEVGYARALGKLIVGYTAVEISFEARTQAFCEAFGGGMRRRSDASLEDAQGRALENFGLRDNLMLDGAIAASGGCFVGPQEAAAHGLTPLELAASRLAALLCPPG